MVRTNLETSWTPIDKLDGSLGFDLCNGSIDIFWNNIATVKETTCHIFAMSGVTFDHLVGWFETGSGDFGDAQLLMEGSISRDDWSVGGKRKVDSWIRNQVSLEFIQIDIESSVEAQRSGD